jgi:hypothetical protein
VTVSELIEKLSKMPPTSVVKIFDADAGQFEPVTGMVYGGDEDVIELHSGDIE